MNRGIAVQTGKIILDGETVLYSVKTSSRARRIRLELSGESGLTVVVPKSFSGEVGGLLRGKRRWVLGNLRRLKQAASALTNGRLKQPNTLLYLGQPYKAVVSRDQHKGDSVVLDGESLLISLAPQSRLEQVVEDWYRKQAEKLIRQRADSLSGTLEVTYHKITIRRARTRWGSCSDKGNLSFNWKLVMVPETVVDYVIIHELAHLKEPNHSRSFWRLVEEHCPRWREYRAWLKEHQAELSTGLSIPE